MIKVNIHIFILSLFIILFNYGCSKIRESAGVTRKTPDEFQVIENPPLVIPPDYSLLPPGKGQTKNIDDIENELAQEILFGSNQDENYQMNQLSTMNKILLEANADKATNEIREEINETFANEMKTDDVFQVEWNTEREVLDAVKESERIREKTFNNKSITEGEIPIKKEKIKKKKKKRFIIF